MSPSTEDDPVPVPAPEDRLREVAATICRRQELDDGQLLTLFTAASRCLIERRRRGRDLAPSDDQMELTATEAMILCTEVLKRADLQLFELGMWQAMGSPS